ncbi:MAG TPA: hypothetical protein VII47_15905 [Actinomycetota bacterium]
MIDIGVEEASLEVRGCIQEGTCRFTCPRCGAALTKSIPPPLVQVLIQIGVKSTYLEAAAAAAPPLTGADVLTFQEQLETYGMSGETAGLIHPGNASSGVS